VTFNAPKSLRAVIGRPCYFHNATGEFTKLGPEGKPVTNEISIAVGDPGEAYICIPTEVGYALQASSSSAPPKRPDRLALSYFHDTQHFAFGNRYNVLCPVVAAEILIIRLIT
jgi:hypothetical protein